MYRILAAEELPQNHYLAAFPVPGLNVSHVFACGMIDATGNVNPWGTRDWFRVSINGVASFDYRAEAEDAIAEFKRTAA
jgi:hypothetical protein